MTDLLPPELDPAPLTTLAHTIEQARAYAAASRSANTRRAYRADWHDFTTWCDGHHLPSLPTTPATLALYLTEQAERYKVATIERRLVSINQAHKLAGYDAPTCAGQVRTILKGIRRTKGTAQTTKAPAVVPILIAMVETLPETIIGIRDRALLLVGFAGAFRRSELVSLDVADVQFAEEGVVVQLRRSKTDQEGAGRRIWIPYGVREATCPVVALESWLDAASVTDGPLFRPLNRWGHVQAERLSDKAVARVVKKAAQAAGLDPTHFSGHSLRAGLGTAAATAGVAERSIMKQTGHRSERMV